LAGLQQLGSVPLVMTAASIGAAKGGGYARYLEGKTLQPERGDYYLTPGGEIAQAPGRWLASADTLAQLGIEGSIVDGPDFIALMEASIRGMVAGCVVSARTVAGVVGSM
jgi:hypothetical protein